MRKLGRGHLQGKGESSRLRGKPTVKQKKLLLREHAKRRASAGARRGAIDVPMSPCPQPCWPPSGCLAILALFTGAPDFKTAFRSRQAGRGREARVV